MTGGMEDPAGMWVEVGESWSPLYPGDIAWPIDMRERFWVHVCRLGPGELSGRLGNDTARSRRLTAASLAVAATGESLARSLQVFGDPDARLSPPVARSIQDELHGRQRLLSELLVDLIEWSSCDDDWAYEHRAALDRLQSARALELDFRDFYGARTSMVSAEVEAAAGDCSRLESSVRFDASRLGYLSRDQALDAQALRSQHPARAFKSARARLLSVLPAAHYNERLVLGLSYERLYGRLSRSIHFHVAGEAHPVVRSGDEPPSRKSLRDGLIHAGSLGGECLKRLVRLCGGPAGEVTETLAATHDGPGPNAQVLADLTDGGHVVGDFVIILRRFLAQVVERHVAPTGHSTFRISYLAARPAGADVEDEWPAEFVSPFVPIAAVVEEVERQAPDAASRDKLRRDSDAVRVEARRLIREAWDNGLSARVRDVDAELSRQREEPAG